MGLPVYTGSGARNRLLATGFEWFKDILSVKGKEDKAEQGRNRLLMKFYSGTFRRGTLKRVIVLGCRMSG